MKIAVGSDLHVEFGDIILRNDDNIELLVLAGDIIVMKHLNKDTPRGEAFREFFKRVSQEFPWTIYVMGNHEHYGGDFAKSEKIFNEFLKENEIYNIHLLEKDVYRLGGYEFVCGTLWTDFNDMDNVTMYHAGVAMNDYKGVKNTNDTSCYKFLPKHALRDHCDMRYFLQDHSDQYKEMKRTDNKVVVVTHHAPSFGSIHEQFAHEKVMNGCFASNMDEFIQNNPQIQLWVHGHMHNEFDYKLGATRVVCNPRGYVMYEERADLFQLKVIELE